MKLRNFILNPEQNECLMGLVRIVKLRHTAFLANEIYQNEALTDQECEVEIQIAWSNFWDNLLPIEATLFAAKGEFTKSNSVAIHLTEQRFSFLEILLRSCSLDAVITKDIQDQETKKLYEKNIELCGQIIKIVQDAGMIESEVMTQKNRSSGNMTIYEN